MTDLKALAGRLEEWTLSADLHHNGHLESFVALTDDLRLAASVLGELEEIEGALIEAQAVLAMMTIPDAIKQSSALYAYAAAVRTEARVRKALSLLSSLGAKDE